MSGVRLRYAGIIAFLVQIISLATGLAFTLLITRNLSIIEYGQWGAIGSLVYYGTFASNLLGFWYTRYTARGHDIVKPGILTTLGFSIAGIIPFLIAARMFVADFDQLYPIILFTAIQVVTTSLMYNLVAIVNGKKPEKATYAFLVFEILKVIIAFIFVSGKGLTLIDAITIVIIAESIRAVLLLWFLRKDLNNKMEFKNIRKMIKTLWLPFYNRISGLVFTTDVLVVSLLTLSYTNIAFFKIAFVFSAIVQYGSQLTFPLYIKLLGGGKTQDVESTLRLLFMFTIPLGIGIFLLSKPLLFLLNPEYAAAETILRILVVYSFSLSINDFLYNTIQGQEKVDMMSVKFHDLVHSTLFTLPTLNLIRVSSYLSFLIIFIMVFISDEISSKSFGEYWAIILLLTNIPITFYLSKMLRQRISIRIPWISISKYVFAASIMGAVIYFSMELFSFNPKVTIFAIEIFSVMFAAIGIYFGIMLLIDKYTRTLFRDGISLIGKS